MAWMADILEMQGAIYRVQGRNVSSSAWITWRGGGRLIRLILSCQDYSTK